MFLLINFVCRIEYTMGYTVKFIPNPKDPVGCIVKFIPNPKDPVGYFVGTFSSLSSTLKIPLMSKNI